MSLPLPPQLLAPQTGARGGTVGGGVGGMGAGAGIATAAMAGINGLLTGLSAKRERDKQQAANTFKTGMEMLTAGIPGVDMDAVAKAAKKLGLPLDFEGKSAPPSASPAATMPQPSPGLGGGGVNGGVPTVNPAVAAVLAQAQGAGSQSTPRPQLPQGVAGSGYTAASPAGQGLGQMYQRAVTQRTAADSARDLEMQTNVAKMRVLGEAIRDLSIGNTSSTAIDTATRLKMLDAPQGVAAMHDLAKRILPPDKLPAFESNMLNHFVGADDMERARMDYAARAEKNRTDMMVKTVDQAVDLMKTYENMDFGSAVAITQSQYAEKAETRKKALEYAAKFRTRQQGDVDRELARMYGVDSKGNVTLDGKRFGLDVQRLGLERERVSQGWSAQSLRVLEIGNEVQKTLYNADKTQFDKYMSMYINAKTPEDKELAARGVASISERLGTRELRVPGAKNPVRFNFDTLEAKTIDGWWRDTIELQRSTKGAEELAREFTGTPSTGGRPTTGPQQRSSIPLNVPYPHSGVGTLPSGPQGQFNPNDYIRALLERQVTTPLPAVGALLGGK